jgi:hypothetical protein
MYCPQCGQQQVSSELRFCSRCGFPLAGVGELLATGGVIARHEPPSSSEPKKISPRRKGVQQGVALIFLAAVLTPLFGALNAYLNFPELFAALTAIIGFIGGFLRILYAAIFEEGAPKILYLNPNQQVVFPAYQQPAQPGRALGDSQNRGNLLPPQQGAPVPRWRRPDTAELSRPPSVTENTTKLLDKIDEEEKNRGQ